MTGSPRDASRLRRDGSSPKAGCKRRGNRYDDGQRGGGSRVVIALNGRKAKLYYTYLTAMNLKRLSLDGPVLITPVTHGDVRGWFRETWKDGWFREHVADVGFVQDNHSLSRPRGTIRGLHYQGEPFAQGKLIRCLTGEVYDVAVDIRPGSPTFGRWIAEILTARAGEQLWIPHGFAHGFCTLTPDVEIAYKVTAPYSAAHDRGVAFDDPDIAVDWPIAPDDAILSDKDRALPRLRDINARD